MPGQNPVGIDLGTARTAMAGIDPAGRSAMVRSREGDLFLASVVLLDDSQVIVGREAKAALERDPDRVADCPLRDLGQPFYGRPVRGRQLPPETLLACILRRARADLVAAGLANPQAVIAVPGPFDETRRQAAIDAAEMAGLPTLGLIAAPTAAALALAEQAGFLDAAGSARPPSKAMVFAMGAGGIDVSLCELSPGGVRALASEGELQLGGREWDARLRDHLADEFSQRHGADPRRDPAALARLDRVVEEAKHTLSARDSAPVRVDFAGRSLELAISRALFEELTADLLERAAYCVRQTLAAAGAAWPDVHEILLVGGATRMPMVARMLRSASGLEPRSLVNVEEAVARGAALQAAAMLRAREPGSGAAAALRAVRVVDVAACSTGVEKPALNAVRGQYQILIPRGAPLPASASETLTAREPNLETMVIRVLQGESPRAEQCALVAEASLQGFPRSMARGTPITVSYQLDSDGRLAVSAVLASGVALDVRLRRPANLSDAALVRWREVVASGAGFEAYSRAAQLEPGSSARQAARKEPIAEAPAATSVGSYRDPGASDDAYDVVEEPAPASSAGGEFFAPPDEPASDEGSYGAEAPWLEPSSAPAADRFSPAEKSARADSFSPGDSISPDEAFPPAGSSPGDSEAAAADSSDEEPARGPRRRPKRQTRPALRFMINAVAQLSASLLGLGLGYYILCRISPERNFLHLKLPGIPLVAPADASPAEPSKAKP